MRQSAELFPICIEMCTYKTLGVYKQVFHEGYYLTILFYLLIRGEYREEYCYIIWFVRYFCFDPGYLYLFGSFLLPQLYLSLAVKSKQVHFDSNSLRHFPLNNNVVSDMSKCDVVEYVFSSFVYILYKECHNVVRTTINKLSIKCNSSYGGFNAVILSTPRRLDC